MIDIQGKFKCLVISPNNLIFEDEVSSLFLTGDRGEYELLPYHYPLLGVLKKGNIIIDWKKRISINGGVVRFYANECVIMIEEKIVEGIDKD